MYGMSLEKILFALNPGPETTMCLMIPDNVFGLNPVKAWSSLFPFRQKSAKTI
jgi:hypothetical protein